MRSYEICKETLAIIPIENYRSKVVETEKEFIVDKTPMEIVEGSCRYFGSSFVGRLKGTKSLTGVTHKSPIIIEETSEIIFFPTSSPRLYECCWISLGNISEYKRGVDNSIILFNTGYKLDLDMSYGSLDNQILRATRLESVLRKRKII